MSDDLNGPCSLGCTYWHAILMEKSIAHLVSFLAIVCKSVKNDPPASKKWKMLKKGSILEEKQV